MANNVSTYALGRFIELAAQASAGNGDLVLVLFKSVGAATDTTMRNAQTLAALTGLGLVECDFSSYARKVLSGGGTDYTIATNTTTFTQTVTFVVKVWNPAGGVTNNNPIKSTVVYRPTAGSADSACTPLGVFDATGSAAGGTYSHTPGALADDA